jgi:alpha-ketoglutarate-dependent taurine dioxygenase
MANQSVHSDYEQIEVHKVGGNIGAEIRGVRIGGDLAPEAVAEVRRALLRNRVVFLCGQDHADDETQRDFAARFGTATKPHPTVAGDGEAVLPIDSERSRANSWHTDVTIVDRIPSISILRAITLPPYGGSTVWGNTVRAYEQLPPALQALADQLWGSIQTSTTTRVPRSRSSTRRIATSSNRCSSRPSTRSYGCTRRPASARSC